jgi:hypothetical protein
MGPADPRCRVATLSECGCRPPGGGGASMQTGHRLRTARARRVAPGRVPAARAQTQTRKRPASAVSLWCLLSFRAALNCCCSTEHIHIGHIHNAVARIPTLVTHTPDSPERYTPKQHTSTGATISCCCCCSTQRAQPEPPDPKHGSRYSRTVVWPLPVSTSVVSSAFPSR